MDLLNKNTSSVTLAELQNIMQDVIIELIYIEKAMLDMDIIDLQKFNIWFRNHDYHTRMDLLNDFIDKRLC